MSLDFPAAGQALWKISDATGVRPEYLLPVLWLESNFNPSIVNSIGCTGINQQCPPNVPAGYASWSASQQLGQVVLPEYVNIVRSLGPIGSATRAYQANLLPSTLATARSLSSVIAQKGSIRLVPRSQLTEGAVYSANAGLDADGSGAITVGDLATEMRKMLASPSVQSAIAQTYALRPGASPVSDPVLGSDFGFQWSAGEVALVVVAVAAVGAAGWALATGRRAA